jgi:hypothetical protein
MIKEAFLLGRKRNTYLLRDCLVRYLGPEKLRDLFFFFFNAGRFQASLFTCDNRTGDFRDLIFQALQQANN